MERERTFLDLNLTERDALLGVAVTPAEGDRDLPHGQAVRSWLGERRSTPHGPQLYRSFASLEDAGLIEKVELNKRDTGLRLTDEGEALVESHSRLLAEAVNETDGDNT